MDVVRRRGPSEEARTPPEHPLAVRHSRWRQRLDKRLHRPVIARKHLLAEPAWQRRFEARGLEHLSGGLEERAVIAVTLHYGAVSLLRGYLASRGVSAAVVVNDRLSDTRRRPDWLAAGEPRRMLEYLMPGRCLVVAADFQRGRTLTVSLPVTGPATAAVTLASGPFRLARLSGALIVPVIIAERSRWRYRVDVCEPVPDALLASGDEAAARHVLAQLWPLILRDPGQARDRLVEAVRVTAVPQHGAPAGAGAAAAP